AGDDVAHVCVQRASLQHLWLDRASPFAVRRRWAVAFLPYRRHNSQRFLNGQRNSEGDQRKCCRTKVLSTVRKSSRCSEASWIRSCSHCRKICAHPTPGPPSHETFSPVPIRASATRTRFAARP